MKNSWKLFITLYLIQFFQLLDFLSISSIGALLIKNNSLVSDDISQALLFYSVSAIVSTLTISKFRTFQTRNLLVILIVGFLIGQLILLWKVSSITFLVSKIVTGLTGGLMGSIAYSQLTQIDQGKRLGLWNGRIQTVHSASTLVGLPLAITLVTKLGFGSYLYLMIIFSLILIFLTYFSSIKNIHQADNSRQNKLKFSLSHSDVLISGFMIYFASFLFINHLANYLLNVMQVTANQLSISYMIGGAGTLAFAGKLGHLTEQNSAVKLLAISVSTVVLIQLLFNFMPYTSFLLYGAVPTYLIISNARAIYQRGIILQKKPIDSLSLHLLNNFAMRLGIVCSGVVLSIISTRTDSIGRLFASANMLSISTSLAMLIILVFLSRPLTK